MRRLPALDYMPLHYAVMERPPEMVRTLMQFGADPYMYDGGYLCASARGTATHHCG